MPKGKYKRTKEQNKKISETLKKKGIKPKQIPWTDERREKLAEAKRGKPSWNKGLKCSNIPGNKKIHYSGKLHWNYIDGRSKNHSPKRYGDDWEAIRYLVYLRDHFTCRECGIKGISLDIHHKIPFLISFDNSLNNLITLCRSCHMKRENLIKKGKKRGEINYKDLEE